MAVEPASSLKPIQVKNEDVAYSGIEDRGQKKGEFTLFKLESQLPEGKQRVVESLAKSDISWAILHTIKHGGENQLHAHRAEDATWLALEGEVTFYGHDHQEVARLNAREGLFIPRGTPYYFRSTGEETAVIMRVSAKATDVPNERLDYEHASNPNRSARTAE